MRPWGANQAGFDALETPERKKNDEKRRNRTGNSEAVTGTSNKGKDSYIVGVLDKARKAKKEAEQLLSLVCTNTRIPMPVSLELQERPRKSSPFTILYAAMAF